MKVILIILAVGLSLASLLLLAITLSMAAQYSGQRMGNEAYGYFSMAFALTLFFSIPTIVLWLILYKYRKQPLSKKRYFYAQNNKNNEKMKSLIILIILTALISCNNNVQKSVDKQAATIEIADDKCHPLAAMINYQAEQPIERTIDFVEGQDTCRIVPDTSNGHIYVQKKIGADCWQTLETVFEMCNQCTLELIDWNDDGFIDLYWSSKHYADITFYDPKTKGFRHAVGTKKSNKYPLSNRINYNLYDFYPRYDTTWSDLYRYGKFELKHYALLKVYDEELESQTKKIIELYALKGGKDSLIQVWKSKEFPAFIKEGNFDTDDFIKDYWTKNWKRFVPN